MPLRRYYSKDFKQALRGFIEKKLKELLYKLAANNEKIGLQEETYLYGELNDLTFELLNTLAEQNSKELDIAYLKEHFKIRIAGVIKSAENFIYMKKHDSSIDPAITSSHNAVLSIESEEQTTIITKWKGELKNIPKEKKQVDQHFSTYSHFKMGKGTLAKSQIAPNKLGHSSHSYEPRRLEESYNDNNPTTLFEESYQDLINKNYQAASVKLKKYLELKPNNPNAWFNNAIANYHLNTRKGDEEALRSFIKCIDINPKDFEAIKGRATVYLALKNKEEAIKYYKQALTLAPDKQEEKKIQEEAREHNLWL